jgi:hypothetical protein
MLHEMGREKSLCDLTDHPNPRAASTTAETLKGLRLVYVFVLARVGWLGEYQCLAQVGVKRNIAVENCFSGGVEFRVVEHCLVDRDTLS